MPVYMLGPDPVFPPVERAEPEGLLAIGGDLSPARLVEAYKHGIFPWYEAGGPILWWSPDPRLVLFPEELHVSRRLERTIRQARFETRYDTAFPQVISACASTFRPGEEGTWITPEMQAAYIRLHELGVAHCMESWRENRLVGGIYGIKLDQIFFGESMFHHETDASKVAFVALVRHLQTEGVTLLDCQVTTGHVQSLGGREIPRTEFIRLIEKSDQ